MEKKIVLNFPPHTSRDEKIQLTTHVNNALEHIGNEVAAWCGFVEVLRNEENGYTLIAIADNEEIRDKMQDLLEKIEVSAPQTVSAIRRF